MARALHGSHVSDDPELLLRQLTAYSLDYALLTERVFGWTPRPWQKEILQNPERNTITCTHRQAGKSETVCALAASVTLSPLKPNSTSLVVSAGREQAHDLMRRITFDLKAAEKAGLTRITELSKSHIVLEDNSRVASVASTENATRGYSISGLLIVDECAHIPDEIVTAILPTVAAAGGAIALLSTPNGRMGSFSDVYHSGDPSWHRTTVKSSDPDCCLPESLLEQQRLVLGRSRFMQEFECSFLESTNYAFSHESLETAFGATDARIWEQPEEDPIINVSNPFAGSF